MAVNICEGAFMSDRIFIRDLSLRCIIGIYPDERREKQDVIINVVMEADLSAAPLSDAIEDTVNYKSIKKEIMQMVEASDYNLIETMASRILDICLKDGKVQRATVTVDKPGALRFARSVAVEMSRQRA
jgi:dihydroneopterin aldolase/D-erythro-7,8-dihydroneopterin triphosphate epimerase